MNTPNAKQWVDFENGLVDRIIFSDPEIYKMEMERIFARAWSFICHESQIPRVGDFFQTYIGEDRILAVRDKSGAVSVLLNTCRHRGNAVCRAEQGNAKVFTCPYHGWSYGLDGELVGVPGQRDFYRNDLDKKEWGLARAAQVTSYRGFVFANLDPAAIPLDEYLGDVGRIGLDFIAERGDVEVIDGIQKNVVACNWKLAVDNLYDWYHPVVSHRSAIRSGVFPRLQDEEVAFAPMSQMVMLGEYGHGVGGPMIPDDVMAEVRAHLDDPDAATSLARLSIEPWRFRAKAHEALGPHGIRSRGHPSIFPNVWITLNGAQLCLRIPRGPMTTELWWFTFANKNATAEQRRALVRITTHMFGPAGLLEQDDGENWDQCTRGTIGPVARRYPLNFAMGRGRDRVRDVDGHRCIETVVNEHGQRWTYLAWAEWMDAVDWPDLRRNHSPAPSGAI